MTVIMGLNLNNPNRDLFKREPFEEFTCLTPKADFEITDLGFASNEYGETGQYFLLQFETMRRFLEVTTYSDGDCAEIISKWSLPQKIWDKVYKETK